MLTAFLLTLKIASLLTSTGHDASDSHLFAMACTRNATALVSAERRRLRPAAARLQRRRSLWRVAATPDVVRHVG